MYKNYFVNNNVHAQDDINPFSNFWNNSRFGNYWDNHSTTDINEDGIDDTPYEFISGTANANDSLPIYGNPFHTGYKIYIDGTQVSGIIVVITHILSSI